MINFISQKSLIFVTKLVSIILTFTATFNWNTILIEYKLMKRRKKICSRARSSGSIWKTLSFYVSSKLDWRFFYRLLNANWSQPDSRFPDESRSLFFSPPFSRLFVRSRKLVATFFIRTGREHLEHRRFVTTTAPMMASPSMLSGKRGWSRWKNTSAKVRRNWSAPVEPTFHARSRIVGNERDF